MTLPDAYEPAERDPKKLRRTAWTLVVIMLLGGWLVMKSYEKWAVRQSADDRPSVVYRIPKERDLRVIRQDGKTMDLFDLRGHVWAIHVMSLENPAPSARSLAVMKRLSASFADTPDFNLVTLAVDSVPAGEILAKLTQAAEAQGMKLPQWWLGSNEAATLHKFIKNELKATIFPHQENGAWVFDPTIVLIDRNGHIRRAVVPQKQGGPPYVATFDFDQAAKWDADGKKTSPHSDRTNVAELESLLEKTIHTLLAEKAEAP